MTCNYFGETYSECQLSCPFFYGSEKVVNLVQYSTNIFPILQDLNGWLMPCLPINIV